MAFPVMAGLSILGGIGGFLNSRAQARGYEKAGNQAAQTANQGFNWLNQSPIGTQYLPMGGQAIGQQGALLGLGGDQAAAQQAYRNYLGSTGYQAQMNAGQQAITGSAAARGLLGSGSTAKSLTRFGQDLGAQSFNNYLAQLQGLSGMGLQAGGMIGGAALQGGLAGAGYQYGGMTGASDARAAGWDQLMGGFGGGVRHAFPGSFPAPAGGAAGQMSPAVMQNVPPNILQGYG